MPTATPQAAESTQHAWLSIKATNFPQKNVILDKVLIVLDDSLSFLKVLPPFIAHGVLTIAPLSFQGAQKHHQRIDLITPKEFSRFENLSQKTRSDLRQQYKVFSEQIFRILAPGGHAIIGASPLFSTSLFFALGQAGLEKRAEIVQLLIDERLISADPEEKTPKRMLPPIGAWHPWGVFRRPPLAEVERSVREIGTGRIANDFANLSLDVLPFKLPKREEKAIFEMKETVALSTLKVLSKALLPARCGIIIDPFVRSGDTLAAIALSGGHAVGVVQSKEEFFKIQNILLRLLDMKRTG